MGVFPFIVALLLSGVLAWPIYKGLVAAKSRQTVSKFAPEGHQKKQGTPTMGGLIVLVGLIAGFGVLAVPQTSFQPLIRSALALILSFGLIGFIDDFVVPRMMPGTRGLGWKQKIAMQFLFAGLSLIPVMGTKFSAGFGFSVIVLLFFANAYNFSDGLDALAGTIALGFSVGLVGLGFLTANMFCVQSGLVLTAAMIPFLVLNAPPAKIFMGDVGSLAVGALLGLNILALIPNLIGVELVGFGPKALSPISDAAFAFLDNLGRPSPEASLNPTIRPISPLFGGVALILLSWVMIAELVPVPLQVGAVKLFKRKLFRMTPIHHGFEKAGWVETRIVFVFALVQLICSLVAVALVVLGRG